MTSHSITWSALLSGLHGTPERLSELLAGMSSEETCPRPDVEAWSLCEIVSHMCAVEPPYRARLLRIALEDCPHVAAIDRITGGYDPQTPIGILLDTFAALRAGTLAFLESLPAEARARPALHAQLGPTTLRGQAEALLAHDEGHLAEIAIRLGKANS
jgi:hypothetical protein